MKMNNSSISYRSRNKKLWKKNLKQMTRSTCLGMGDNYTYKMYYNNGYFHWFEIYVCKTNKYICAKRIKYISVFSAKLVNKSKICYKQLKCNEKKMNSHNHVTFMPLFF